MELKRIDDISVFEHTVRSYKAKFPKGTIFDNCYFMPNKLTAICSQGRLYQLHNSLDNLAFLVDEGNFYRLYLWTQGSSQLIFDAIDKPLLAEVLYQEGRLTPHTELLMQSFEKSGFHLHKTNRQFQQRIPNRTTIEAKLGSMLKNCKQRGFFVASAQMDDFEQIRALWDRLIDPYAFTYISHDQWQQEIQAGRLQCVKDEKGIVVAAQQYSLEQKKSQESHIVVESSLQGKGLATTLLQRWLFFAAQAGCINALCWIAEDNTASIYLHKGFVKSNRLSVQYVREQ